MLDLVREPLQSNSVGARNVSQSRTPVFDGQIDPCVLSTEISNGALWQDCLAFGGTRSIPYKTCSSDVRRFRFVPPSVGLSHPLRDKPPCTVPKRSRQVALR